jgi:hypothetical protein
MIESPGLAPLGVDDHPFDRAEADAAAGSVAELMQRHRFDIVEYVADDNVIPASPA